MLNDLRRSPATATLAILWVLVFAMMHARQGKFSWGLNPFAIGSVEVAFTHQFGDATTAEIWAGQLWRVLTSTFIHYSLVHLALNLFGLLELGLLIEEWYGSALFLAICLLIGGLGNLIAGLARPWFGISPYVHSGGGSTIIFGLIGLCAVVGLRSKTEEGRGLGAQMLVFLGLNVLIGVAVPLLDRLAGLSLPALDNLAHAGGTVVGAAIGLAHRRIVAAAERPVGRLMGGVAGVVLIACMSQQTLANRDEIAAREHLASNLQRRRAAQAAAAHLVQLDVFYRVASLRGRPPDPGSEVLRALVGGIPGQLLVQLPTEDQVRSGLETALRGLREDEEILGAGPGERAYRRVAELAERATLEPPTPLRVKEFESYLAVLMGRTERQASAALAEMQASGALAPGPGIGLGPRGLQAPTGPAASQAPGS